MRAGRPRGAASGRFRVPDGGGRRVLRPSAYSSAAS